MLTYFDDEWEPTATTMDVLAYHRLEFTERDAIDKWLRACGGDPHRTWAMTLGEGVVVAHEYVMDADDRFVVEWNERTAERGVVRRDATYPAPAPPPCWTVGR